MNPRTIAEQFRIAAEADPAFAGVACMNAQGSDVVDLPRIVFSATFKPLTGRGGVGAGTVSMAVESHAGDEDGSAHGAIVEKLRVKFFGDAAARSALAAIITGAGVIEVDPRYVAIGEPSQTRDGDRFKTVLMLRAGVYLLPV